MTDPRISEIIEIVAKLKLWRDDHADGPDIIGNGGYVRHYFKPDHVRAARETLKAGKETIT